jgi:cytoskeleton protein RodZ
VTSFGAQLKKEREKQGITLEEISVSTKIGTRMLRALEEEHFDQLPGGIFNKGFIRAYARCLHMDEDQAIADYLAATGATPEAKKSENDAQPPILEPPEREQNTAAGLPWGIFAVVLLIIALGFAGWGFYSRESQKSTPQATPSAVNTPNLSPPATAEPSPPERKPSESVDSAPTAPNPAQQTSTPALATPSPALSTPGTPPVGSQPQPAVPAHETFLVVIKAREDSWLSVSVDGETVTRALLAAPAQKSVRADKEIVVKAGNIGALDFEFNGRKLPTQGDYGEVKTLTFDAHGLQPAAPKPETPAQLP